MPHCETHGSYIKVVVRLDSEVIKGYVEPQTNEADSSGLFSAYDIANNTIHLRRVGSTAFEELSLAEAKAIFCVDSFDGDLGHNALHFHTHTPVLPAIWLRLEFQDGEVMEGIADNTIDYLVHPGFYLRPTDPDSNNHFVYVVKKTLKDIRVLGLRAPCPDWESPGICATRSRRCAGHLRVFDRACPHNAPLFDVEDIQIDSGHATGRE
jgi:hypothetical protein